MQPQMTRMSQMGRTGMQPQMTQMSQMGRTEIQPQMTRMSQMDIVGNERRIPSAWHLSARSASSAASILIGIDGNALAWCSTRDQPS